MMPLYEQKEGLFYHVHPLTMTIYIMSVFILGLALTHPVYQGLLFMVTLVALWVSGNIGHWRAYAKFALPMVVILMVVNGIFVKAGATVLYNGPTVPVFGKLRITLEALAYGGGMGLRLLVVISIFCLFTYTVQPDRFMKLFGPFGNRTVFVMTLAIRLFPLMVTDYRRIIEVQRCRGVQFDHVPWHRRVKNIFPVTSVLLLSSLERSFLQAESMYARGYGSGMRTVFHRELWRRRDTIMVALTLGGLLVGIITGLTGDGLYTYYPRMGTIKIKDLALALLVAIPLLMPVVMDWGWRRWPALRSKI